MCTAEKGLPLDFAASDVEEMTLAERTLWKALRKNQIDGLHFRRQQIIAGFIVGFYCHSTALVIEVDGDVHHSAADYDRERDRLFERHGFEVL